MICTVTPFSVKAIPPIFSRTKVYLVAIHDDADGEFEVGSQRFLQLAQREADHVIDLLPPFVATIVPEYSDLVVLQHLPGKTDVVIGKGRFLRDQLVPILVLDLPMVEDRHPGGDNAVLGMPAVGSLDTQGRVKLEGSDRRRVRAAQFTKQGNLGDLDLPLDLDVEVERLRELVVELLGDDANWLLGLRGARGRHRQQQQYQQQQPCPVTVHRQTPSLSGPQFLFVVGALAP
jgi:hypothetical protein